MAVQFGVHIGAQNATVEELRTLWKWLDEAGTDWISLWDHLYEAPPAGGTQPHFEVFSMLGALAVDTSRARLGCLVFCSQYRNIGVLMKGAISVDHLSRGRFEMGMGSGWHDQEAAAFGIDFPSQGDRFKVLEGQLQAINSWRNGERVTQSSPSVELRDASMIPAPMGSMPLWLGGLGPKQTLRMAGTYGNGWNAAYASPAQYKDLNAILDDWCVKAGREPQQVERSINLSFGLSKQDVGVVKTQLHSQWGQAADRIISGSLLGRPEDAMEQIAPFIEAGAELVNIAIRPPWDQEVLAEYIENVVPLMKREWSTVK